MNSEELDRLEKLAASATAEPWRTDGISHDDAEDGHLVLGGGEPGSMAEHLITWVGTFCNRRAEADAEFIAASREALPALVAAHRRVLALLDEQAAYCSADLIDVPSWVGSVRTALEGPTDE